ncbi:glycosyltransferase [Pontibacter silvestris]|uniref:Glycosyltransferase n=1 Tax=Pontibacter silvestris TaxID=2305183 RepID=A0ABW4WUK2_9BACT|nr:glycosyltransferase [Pontibacter silvestris]MCC9138099.1 glycosyltransferase [Pontibacter silvestris]
MILVTQESNKYNSSKKTEPQLLKPLNNVSWVPLTKIEGSIGTTTLFQILNVWQLPFTLKRIIISNEVTCVLAHGAPAGALAYKVWKKTKVPFYVSSFEPHADYMAETNTWRKSGLKYIFQKYWEQQQKKYAAGLMPVTQSYKQQLLTEGVLSDKIFTVPVGVEAGVFVFSNAQREQLRAQLKINSNDIVGVYVGKYGGLYLEDEAFEIYRKCFKMYPNFRLIILSPQGKEHVQKKLVRHKIDLARVFVASVSHHEVPAYLSAADFAFATIKSYPSARYCSPVKIGEYWANGLPVLLTEGVGDDNDIIKKEGGGALFNLREEGSVERALEKIQQILKDPAHRQEIPKLAQKYRSPDSIREAYEYFFGKEEV